ncbi:MAG: RluA family pseudouridine synthase, partial [Firmicutes bacterium]|nr:RluA family pseudouridine synthase [Bacillota bacterium]
MAERITYTLTAEDEALYTREILQQRLHFSGRLIKKIKYEGQLLLAEKPVRMRDKGSAGDILTVVYPEESSYFEPEDIPVRIAYEDSDLLIFDKEPFYVVHPTKNYQTGTMANA